MTEPQPTSTQQVTTSNPEKVTVPLVEKATQEDVPVPTQPKPAGVDRNQMSNEWKRDNPE
jgi:hypothetical protein